MAREGSCVRSTWLSSSVEANDLDVEADRMFGFIGRPIESFGKLGIVQKSQVRSDSEGGVRERALFQGVEFDDGTRKGGHQATKCGFSPSFSFFEQKSPPLSERVLLARCCLQP